MNAGTDRRIREKTMRHGILNPGTRALRQRYLPTKNGHAGSARVQARAIHDYQSDSSSKRPALSSVLRSCHPPGRRKTTDDLRCLLDWRSFHIRFIPSRVPRMCHRLTRRRRASLTLATRAHGSRGRGSAWLAPIRDGGDATMLVGPVYPDSSPRPKRARGRFRGRSAGPG
jgi:hypothetical protein